MRDERENCKKFNKSKPFKSCVEVKTLSQLNSSIIIKRRIAKSIILVIICLVFAWKVQPEVGVATQWNHTNDTPLIEAEIEIILDPYENTDCNCPRCYR